MTVLAGWDADLGDAVAAGRLGEAPADLAAFESAFVRAVEAADDCPSRAWNAFYDATLARVEAGWGQAEGRGTVATFSRIWAKAASLSRGPVVLDVGTCFGFLPLAWAVRTGAPRLLAVDVSPSATALAGRQARRLARPVDVLCADGARLPVGDRSVGTVLLVHVLEHLPPAAADRVLREALRVATDRVVVAVPVEATPDPVFGHLQVFDLGSLARLGASTGWPADLHGSDGAWLVLDRPGNRP